MPHPSWLPPERWTADTFIDRLHPSCVCQWEKTGHPHGEGRYWRLVERKRGCVLHGASGEH